MVVVQVGVFPSTTASLATQSTDPQNERQTYPDEAENPRPHAEVRALSPPPLVHHAPLIHATADQVDHDGYREDDEEHPRGGEAVGVRGRTCGSRACVSRPDFEDVGAVVGGAEEGDHWVVCKGGRCVATERQQGRFVAVCLLRCY